MILCDNKPTRLLCIAISLVVLVSIGGCLSEEKQAAPDNSGNSGNNTGNSAPIISGAPANAALTGSNYTFTPFASDRDGDRLTFSVQNLPRWASFNPGSGRLSGQVFLGDEGTYDNIQISVSDGSASSELRAFSITVTQTAPGSMSLSWSAPSENSDGTALTDLAGYKLYYGVSQGDYPNQILIDNPSVSSYLIENLLPDTYYVVATSFNTAGAESNFSNVAVRTVESN